MEKLTKRVCGNTDLIKKGKTMRKTIQNYLSGFEIKQCTVFSFFLCVAAITLSVYTPYEDGLINIDTEALWSSKAALPCFILGMLLIKTLLLRKLDLLFDIVTLFILMSSLYSMS